MKWIAVLVMILFAVSLSTNAFAFELKYQIDDAKVPRIVAAMKGLYPIPDANADEIPDFTDNAWAKEAIRRFVITSVARWETAVAQRAINIPTEDDLVR